MALKVYTFEEVTSGPKTSWKHILQQKNFPKPDSGPGSNINSP
jgi:hypothetical protein